MRAVLLATAFFSLSLVALPPVAEAQNPSQALAPGATSTPELRQSRHSAWPQGQFSRREGQTNWQRHGRGQARWQGYRAARRHAYWRNMRARRGMERYGRHSGRGGRGFSHQRGYRGWGQQGQRYNHRSFRGSASPTI